MRSKHVPHNGIITPIWIRGALAIFINGKIVREIPNLVVDVGKDWLASRMGGVVDDVMSHMAIGSGTTAADALDTAMETEITRNALNVPGGVVLDNTIVYECTWAADDPDITAPDVTTVSEAGLFNDVAAGTMLAHSVFAAVSKGETDTMTISWTLTLP